MTENAPDSQTRLEELKDLMRQFVAERQWQPFHQPKNLTMSLAIEAAELMEHFQWLDHDQADALLADPAQRRQIADEMADVLAFLLSLANRTGIDLAQAFRDKMTRNETKYPADAVRGQYRRPGQPDAPTIRPDAPHLTNAPDAADAADAPGAPGPSDAADPSNPKGS